MVKLKGPGLAQAAAGGLGETLIFAQSKGRAYAKKWHRPANPNTADQKAIRAITRFCSTTWATLSDADKATWEQQAAKTNIPPYNAFIAYNLERWRQFRGPTPNWPPTEAGGTSSVTNTSVTALPRRARLGWQVGTLGNGWAIGWCLIPSAPSVPTWNSLLHVTLIPAPSTWYYHDAYLPNGTYFFNVLRLNKFGLIVSNSYIGTCTIV
jgi:hypothetical protein